MARDDLMEWTDRFFLEEHGLLKRKTFGAPSYYKNGKMAAFLFEDGLGIKLPDDQVGALVEKNAHVYGRFDPMGKGTMKGWLIITHPDVPSYEDERGLIEESLEKFQGK